MKRWLWLLCLAWLLPVHGEGVLSPSIHRGLQQAGKFQQGGHYRRSLTILRSLGGKARSEVDKALLHTYLAYGWMGVGNIRKASRAAHMALENPALPKRLQPELWLLLGQAALQRGRYASAAKAFRRALTLTREKDGQIHYLVAYALYQQKHYAEAIAHLQQAMKRRPSPPEDWYRLLLACCLEGKRYDLGEQILKQLLSRHPEDSTRWRQLAALYLQRGRYHEGLAALVAAWHEGALDHQTLLRIVHLYAHIGVPEKAARLLRRWRLEQRLPAEREVLTLEGDLWRMARERESAVEVLRQVAGKEKDGGQWLWLANLYGELERWGEVAAAAKKAIRLGVERPASARLLSGIAALRAGRRHLAVRMLEAARRDDAMMAQADYWLRCARGERSCP